MKKLLIGLAVMGCVGCRGVNRLIDGPPNTPPQQQVIGDDWVLDADTISDNDLVNVPTGNRTITVSIKVNDHWQTLNRYEYVLYTRDLPMLGAVRFGRRVDVNGDGTLTIYQEPVAPKGAEIKIESIKE